MFDLDTGRVKVGLAVTDKTQDLLITMGMNAALAIAENYCDRYFLYKKDVATFLSPPGPRLQLKRYPIINVEYVGGLDGSTDNQIDSNAYRVHHIHGYLTFGQHYHHHNHPTLFPWHFGRDIKVKFDGGYKLDELPADLEIALWGIFSVVWKSLDPNASAANMASPGAISSISIPDVGTVSFGQGGASASASVAGSAAFSQYGPFFHLLDGYRDLSC